MGSFGVNHTYDGSTCVILGTIHQEPQGEKEHMKKVQFHWVRTQCQSTGSEHSVRAQGQNTVSEHRVRTQCQSTGSEHSVRAQGQNTVSEHRVRTPCQSTSLKENSCLNLNLGWHPFVHQNLCVHVSGVWYCIQSLRVQCKTLT